MATTVPELQAETVRPVVSLTCTHLWTCFHCQMPGARCSGGPRMGYRLRHWRSESGKTKQGCVYVCLSLQMSIETCSAWFAWNGLHLCMHDCSHLAYKALIGFESFRSQLAKLGAQLALGSVGSDHLQRSHRTAQSEGGRKAKEVSCTLACVLLQGGRILFDCTGEYLIASLLLFIVYAKKAYGRAYRLFYCGLGSRLGFI